MAVVQISKIQLRRGLKNSNSGVPQLSSAEMAWAIDTQELYIGNGSVAEGAPYVGNTKVLTEHDNLLELITSYKFANNKPSINNSVSRSLQDKLDEYVSIADYGAVNDGVTDCTFEFERAFDDLFRNVDTNFRKTLIIPNGTYIISRDLEIPSNAIIRGESRENTIIAIGNNNIKLITDQGTPSPDFDSTDRPENVKIFDLTITRFQGQLILTGLRKGTFSNIIFRGNHFLGKTIDSLSLESSAIYWENRNPGTITTDLIIEDCIFEENGISIKCFQTIETKSEIYLNDCYFLKGNTAIYVDGSANQDTNWKIFQCVFQEMEYSAFRSTQGKNTLIQSSKFIDCGNGTNNAATPVTNIIFFGESRGNLVLDCSFNRQQVLGTTDPLLSPILSDRQAISEVFNASYVNIVDRIYSPIYPADSFRPLTILSSFNKFIKIRYILSIGNHNRSGQINLIVDNDLSFVGITDSYIFSDDLISSEGGQLMTSFEFSAELRNNGNLVRLDTNDSTDSLETIILSYKNPKAVELAIIGDINFDISYGV